jgi:hypothetical protein
LRQDRCEKTCLKSYFFLVLLLCGLLIVYKVLLGQNQYKICANRRQLEILFALYMKLTLNWLLDSRRIREEKAAL